MLHKVPSKSRRSLLESKQKKTTPPTVSRKANKGHHLPQKLMCSLTAIIQLPDLAHDCSNGLGTGTLDLARTFSRPLKGQPSSEPARIGTMSRENGQKLLEDPNDVLKDSRFICLG